MILVTGATGNVASVLIPALLEDGQQVRALIHDESKAKPLKDMGVEVVTADMEKAETLDEAVDGVDKIYLITTNGETGSQQARNVIKAASGPGNAHIVRQSGFGTPECRMIAQHEDIEKELRDSQLRYTIVKPTFFMQNLLMSAQTVASDGAMYWPLGDGRIGMVDVRDVADVAFKVLTSEGHEGKTYVLTGPAAISLGGAAAELSNALNKEVAYVDVPSQALRDSLGEMGMPEWTVEAYAELMEGFKAGDADMTTPSVEQLTGHPARSFETFARDFAGAFGVN